MLEIEHRKRLRTSSMYQCWERGRYCSFRSGLGSSILVADYDDGRGLQLALTLLNERSERIVEQLKTGANFEAALKATVAEIASSSRQRDEANKENCCHHQHKNGASSPSSKDTFIGCCASDCLVGSSAGVAVAGLKSELKLVQRQLDEVGVGEVQSAGIEPGTSVGIDESRHHAD